MNKDFKLLNLMLAYVKPYYKKLFFILFLLPLSSISFSLQPLIVQRAVDGPLKNLDLQGLQPYVLFFAALIIMTFFLQLAQIWFINSTAQKIIADIRTSLFRHLESLPMSFFDRTPVGRSVTRLTSDVEQLSDSFAGGLVLVLVDVFNIVTVLCFMFAINTSLTLLVLAFLVPIYFIARYFQGVYRKANLEARKKLSSLNSFLQQNIVGIQVVQLLSCADKNKKIYSDSNQDYFKANDKTIWSDSNFSASVELVGILSLAALIYLSSKILVLDALSVGVIIAFLQYAQSLFEPVRNLSDRFTVIQSGFTAAERVNELLNEASDIADPSDNEALDIFETNSEYIVEFENVYFKYQSTTQSNKELVAEEKPVNESKWVLENLSFKVKKGDFAAIVGKTGSGKSTIIKLLTRLYLPQKGSIKVNGCDISKVKLKDLRKFIAVIHQDSYTFAGDLESNITLSREGLDMSLAKPFLKTLKIPLDTELNERASNISAGEEQVISFARAVVSNPELIILDEATAKIDLSTEAQIQAALAEFQKDKSSLVIAHRLDTIEKAEQLIQVGAS